MLLFLISAQSYYRRHTMSEWLVSQYLTFSMHVINFNNDIYGNGYWSINCIHGNICVAVLFGIKTCHVKVLVLILIYIYISSHRVVCLCSVSFFFVCWSSSNPRLKAQCLYHWERTVQLIISLRARTIYFQQEWPISEMMITLTPFQLTKINRKNVQKLLGGTYCQYHSYVNIITRISQCIDGKFMQNRYSFRMWIQFIGMNCYGKTHHEFFFFIHKNISWSHRNDLLLQDIAKYLAHQTFKSFM